MVPISPHVRTYFFIFITRPDPETAHSRADRIRLDTDTAFIGKGLPFQPACSKLHFRRQEESFTQGFFHAIFRSQKGTCGIIGTCMMRIKASVAIVIGKALQFETEVPILAILFKDRIIKAQGIALRSLVP